MTWEGELYLEIHNGTYTSMAEHKIYNRQVELLLRDTEILYYFALALSKFGFGEFKPFLNHE